MRTIDAWVCLFDESNKENLPLLKMELTFDDQKMQFYPPYEELEELALFVVTLICRTMQSVPTVSNQSHSLFHTCGSRDGCVHNKRLYLTGLLLALRW